MNLGAENFQANSNETDSQQQQEEDDSLVYSSMEGMLSKESVGMFGSPTWHERYFVLSRGILSYYESKQSYESKSDPIKNIKLPMMHFDVKKDLENQTAFFISPKEILQVTNSVPPSSDSESSAGSEVAMKSVYQGGNITLHLSASSPKQRLRWMRALRGRRADGRHRKDSMEYSL